MGKLLNIGKELKRYTKFPPEYQLMLFEDWYNKGRPPITKFYPFIPPAPDGTKPTRSTVEHWMHEEFAEHAHFLDKQILDEMNKRLVEVKIEMLTRHAKMAVELQKRALQELEAIEVGKLSEAGSIRLLELGIKTEQGSRGIPEMLAKLMKMTDDDLVKEIEKLTTTSSQLRLEANVDDELSDMQ